MDAIMLVFKAAVEADAWRRIGKVFGITLVSLYSLQQTSIKKNL